jgi:hypothetical protein
LICRLRGERQVGEVGAWIDGDCVRAEDLVAAQDLRFRTALQLQGRDHAILGRDVRLMRRGVEREHVDMRPPTRPTPLAPPLRRPNGRWLSQ